MPDGPDRPSLVAFGYVNDLFAGTDREYTGGLRLAWSRPGAYRSRTLVALVQDAWTPEATDLDAPPPGQRPYAGRLLLSVARAVAVGRGSWSTHLSLGTLGPSSGAEAVQRAFHEATGSAPVRGWGSERDDRIALGLGLRRDVPVLRRDVPGGELDLGAWTGATVGTVAAHLGAGLSLRLGRGTTRSVGPPGLVPGDPDFSVLGAPTGTGYGFVGIGLRAVGRDATLGTRGDGAGGVRAEALVAHARAGVVAAFGRWRLGYAHALRTREHRAGPRTHAHGALTLALELR